MTKKEGKQRKECKGNQAFRCARTRTSRSQENGDNRLALLRMVGDLERMRIYIGGKELNQVQSQWQKRVAERGKARETTLNGNVCIWGGSPSDGVDRSLTKRRTSAGRTKVVYG